MVEKTSFLQDKISSKTSGILWLTQGDLKEKPKPFYALNYFFDGLLMNYFQRDLPSHKMPNLFLTKNFNKNLFLGHYNLAFPAIDKEVGIFLDIVANLAEKKSQILILQPQNTDEKLIKKITRRNQFFDFKAFNLP